MEHREASVEFLLLVLTWTNMLYSPPLFSATPSNAEGKKSLGAERVRYKETKWFSEVKCTLSQAESENV